MPMFQLLMPNGDDDWWKELPVKQVEVKCYTEDDDKDDNEPVTLRVKYGPFAAEVTVGQGERWPDQTDRKFLINLPAPFPPAKSTFSLHVRKTPQGSPTGAQWNASFEITAILDGGARLPLGTRSSRFEIGDGHTYDFDAIVNAKAG